MANCLHSYIDFMERQSEEERKKKAKVERLRLDKDDQKIFGKLQDRCNS